MDKLTVRKPTVDDVKEAFEDMISLRVAPPLVLSLSLIVPLVVLLTGNLLGAVLAVVLTSFVHALWARLVSEEDEPG